MALKKCHTRSDWELMDPLVDSSSARSCSSSSIAANSRTSSSARLPQLCIPAPFLRNDLSRPVLDSERSFKMARGKEERAVRVMVYVVEQEWKGNKDERRKIECRWVVARLGTLRCNAGVYIIVPDRRVHPPARARRDLITLRGSAFSLFHCHRSPFFLLSFVSEIERRYEMFRTSHQAHKGGCF